VTPDLHLRTLFILDEHGRIRSTREPRPAMGPIFTLVRGPSSCVWAMRADLASDLATELGRLAAAEPPLHDPQCLPLHADAYMSLVGGQIASGPAFLFPDEMTPATGVTIVDEVDLLKRHFSGWTADEVPERSRIVAVFESGYPVSICFCARSSEAAAEAGVETAVAFRGRGFAPRVTAAWAAAIRDTGRIPLYSTTWSNWNHAKSLSSLVSCNTPATGVSWGA